MTQPALESLVRGSETATWSVIWLHGLGADGYDFEPIVPELGLATDEVRFIFPHAPVRPITINGGMAMRGWFDILGLDRDAEQDADGIRQSEKLVRRLIHRENERGVPCERIFLAGFSQGGAIALQCGLRHPEALAGLICLSTYLPLHETVEAEAHLANRETPIFMAHGEQDPLLPIFLGHAGHQQLSAMGYQVEWHAYHMAHQVSQAEIRDLGIWIKKRMA